MKKIILCALAAVSAGSALADITVNVAPGISQKDFEVEYGYLADMVKPRKDRPEAMRDKLTATDGKFVIKTLTDGAAQYVIPANDREYVIIYTNPGDELTVNLSSLQPLDYAVKGSTLMEDISDLDAKGTAVLNRFRELQSAGDVNPEELQKLQDEYNGIYKGYIAANPKSEAVPYAMMNLEAEDFLAAYDAMTPEAAASPIAVFLAPQKAYLEKKIEAEKRKLELQSGNVTAPDFTFQNMEGKDVSLSDFRGKWVIIDFWGSWCPWCIKGFPKLKEAYAKYSPKLEIVGVACSDPKDKWEAAVKKYELPWVNLYNPEEGGGKLLEDYAVEGFPTKAIINPEGKIVNITTGENPAFFQVLDDFMK